MKVCSLKMHTPPAQFSLGLGLVIGGSLHPLQLGPGCGKGFHFIHSQVATATDTPASSEAVLSLARTRSQRRHAADGLPSSAVFVFPDSGGSQVLAVVVQSVTHVDQSPANGQFLFSPEQGPHGLWLDQPPAQSKHADTVPSWRILRSMSSRCAAYLSGVQRTDM
jgi:hypothetical protein